MNRCERCGQAVPDGLPVCPECLKLAGAGEAEVSAAEELRDIAAILSIEAGTDANIKEALQGILNIAARLERSVSDGEKEEKTAAQQNGGRDRGAGSGPPPGCGINPPRPPCRSIP